jgi:hypothetical protein
MDNSKANTETDQSNAQQQIQRSYVELTQEIAIKNPF